MFRRGPGPFTFWLGRDELIPVAPASDGLAEKYDLIASNFNQLDAVREAARLFSRAESLLEEPGSDAEATVGVAESALKAFKDSGSQKHVPDALRLLVHAQRAYAETLLVNRQVDKAREVQMKCEKMVKEGMELTQELGDKYGEGCMVLSLGELSSLSTTVERIATLPVAAPAKPAKEKNDSLQLLTKAGMLFREAAEPKMEGIASLGISKIWRERLDVEGATEAAEEAMNSFKDAEDKKGEAKAWLALTATQVAGKDVDKALESIGNVDDDMKKEAGIAPLYASVQYAIAEAALNVDLTDEALKAATEANEMFKDARYGKGWEASALGLEAECHIAKNSVNRGVRTIKDGVKAMKARGSKREQVQGLQHLIYALLANYEVDEAEVTCREAVQLCKDIGEKRWEVVLLKTSAHVYLKSKQHSKALETAEKAKTILQEIGATDGAADLVFQITNMNSAADKYTEMGADDKDKLTIEEQHVAANTLVASAHSHVMNGEPEKALDAANEAVELFKDHGDKPGEASAMIALAEAQMANSALEDAMFAATGAHEILQEEGDQKSQVAVLLLMANIRIATGEYKDAMSLAQEMQQLCRDLDDSSGMLKTYFLVAEANLAILMNTPAGDTGKKPYKDAYERALNAAKKAAKVSEDCPSLAKAQQSLAMVYFLSGQAWDMCQAATEARLLYKQCDDEVGQVRAMILTAQSWIIRSKNKKARGILNDALSKAEKIEDTPGEEAIQELLKEVEEKAPAVQMVAVPIGGGDAGPAMAADAGAASGGGGGGAGAMKAYVPPSVDMVKSRIMAMVMDATGSGDDVQGDVPFMDAGIDSLASVELRTNLQTAFGIPLPSTVMFNYPTPQGMADLLVEEATARELTFG
mmetsp:Transcript_28600/g.52483  ORF Transcript_28600/g.52483 Transcript_28600/m.52483 type:complete len:873 (+) Transcript_28600:78-2696(+)